MKFFSKVAIPQSLRPSPAISAEIRPVDFISTWKRQDERTQSSISGLHFGFLNTFFIFQLSPIHLLTCHPYRLRRDILPNDSGLHLMCTYSKSLGSFRQRNSAQYIFLRPPFLPQQRLYLASDLCIRRGDWNWYRRSSLLRRAKPALMLRLWMC